MNGLIGFWLWCYEIRQLRRDFEVLRVSIAWEVGELEVIA